MMGNPNTEGPDRRRANQVESVYETGDMDGRRDFIFKWK